MDLKRNSGLWDRTGVNDLNENWGKLEDSYGKVEEFSTIVDNTSYKVGANFNDVVIDGNNVSGTITDLRVLLRAGPTSKFITSSYHFDLKEDELLYVDYADEQIQITKGTTVAHSGQTYGSGAFYSDSKILLLTNIRGAWMGAIAPHMLAQASAGAAGTTSVQPRLMAQKEGSDYYIYMQSKYIDTRYSRYKLQYQDVPYSSGSSRSNVKVHTLNEVMNIHYNGETGFISEYQQIVQSGAWDLALREENVSDAVGNIAHGDEIENAFIIYLDGVEMDDIPSELTEYETIEFVTLSDVYRDSQTYYPLQDMCTHYKSYYFDANDRSMVMDSSIKMLRDVTVNYFFLSMLSATKIYNNKAISNIDFEVQDLDNPADIHTTRAGIDKIHLFGGNAPLTAELLDHKTTGNIGARVSDAHYNKIYFSSGMTGDELKEGDVIRAKTRFEINIKV